LALAPKFAEAYANRGQAKQSKEDFDGAIADYDAALQLKPEEGTFFARATARESKKDMDGALADYNKVLELNPNSAEAYAGRAVIETLKGNTGAATVDFGKAFAIDPSLRARYKRFIDEHAAGKRKP
jgi:tetratricopeptide (TPR) repeat protein